MLATNCKPTAELVLEARRACRIAEDAIESLTRARQEAQETVRFLQWWRFLNFDPRAAEFLEHLDMGECPPISE